MCRFVTICVGLNPPTTSFNLCCLYVASGAGWDTLGRRTCIDTFLEVYALRRKLPQNLNVTGSSRVVQPWPTGGTAPATRQ